MSNQGIKNNGVNGTGTTSCEGVAPGMHGVPDLASAGRHQATGQRKGRMKWEKAVNKIVIECWIRSEPTKRKYKQRIKKIRDEIGVFPVTEQRLADQPREIRTKKWLTDIEIEEIRRKLERKNSKAEVQENVQEITEHNENKQGQPDERGAQEILVDQGHEIEQQQKTFHICSFPEDDEILVKKAEMERYNEEEKELLMRVAKEIRFDPERIPSNIRYIDRKKVRQATVKINVIVSLIKTETITETNSVFRAAGNAVAEMVGYKNKEMTGDRQPNWRRRILENQKVLLKELGQLNRMR